MPLLIDHCENIKHVQQALWSRMCRETAVGQFCADEFESDPMHFQFFCFPPSKGREMMAGISSDLAPFSENQLWAAEFECIFNFLFFPSYGRKMVAGNLRAFSDNQLLTSACCDDIQRRLVSEVKVNDTPEGITDLMGRSLLSTITVEYYLFTAS